MSHQDDKDPRPNEVKVIVPTQETIELREQAVADPIEDLPPGATLEMTVHKKEQPEYHTIDYKVTADGTLEEIKNPESGNSQLQTEFCQSVMNKDQVDDWVLENVKRKQRFLEQIFVHDNYALQAAASDERFVDPDRRRIA